jgi:hypothetical protein
MMFAGPASILAGYTMLLQLAGAKQDTYLPYGAWQFYVEFGLREDAARHQIETTGFHAAINTRRQSLSETDQLTAWVMACLCLIYDYDDLLSRVWEENLCLTTMEQTTSLTRLHRVWEQIRPFGSPDGLDISLPEYRRQRFEQFVSEKLASLPSEERRQFEAAWHDPQAIQARAAARTAYLDQMDIQMILEPGEHSDTRVSITTDALHIGIICRDTYYLIPYNDPSQPQTLAAVHAQVSAILHNPPNSSELDLMLTLAPRREQNRLRRLLAEPQRQSLARLRTAPLLINWDIVSTDQPLTSIRNRRRGVGDHPLTLFRTNRSMVFDFSHIFFDGAWAASTAEILTNQARRWTQRLHPMHVQPARVAAPAPLDLASSSKLQRAFSQFKPVFNTISGEARVDITPLIELRRALLRRVKPAVRLTVNDILVLHRTIFNQRYRPGTKLNSVLNDLQKNPETRTIMRIIEKILSDLRVTNPSLLIPIDASHVNPKERLFPCSFRNPLANFRHKHDELVALMHQTSTAHSSETADAFKAARSDYLSQLIAFGELMRRYRGIAAQGETMSIKAIQLIAGLPDAMKRFADGISDQFSFINEAIKGEEVFSNIGQVAPGSSLSRFTSAKDDNDRKELVWGIMTDNEGYLCLSLRDFRPAVLALAQAGHESLAQQITQDFAEAFLYDLLTFVEDMRAVLYHKV